jgi:hypothetical protein
MSDVAQRAIAFCVLLFASGFFFGWCVRGIFVWSEVDRVIGIAFEDAKRRLYERQGVESRDLEAAKRIALAQLGNRSEP